MKSAYQALPADLEYRRVVEAKLMSLGVDPASLNEAGKAADKGNEKAADTAAQKKAAS